MMTPGNPYADPKRDVPEGELKKTQAFHDAIKAAVEYVHRSVDQRALQARDTKDGVGFCYQPGGAVTVPCTGVGVLCLELSGKEYHLCDEAVNGGGYLLRRPLGTNEPHFYYGVYYVSQALFQLGGNYWQTYRKTLHDQLLFQAAPNAAAAVEVDDLDFLPVDPEGQPPVLRHEETPCALPAAGQKMRLPARHGSQLFLPLHVLQEGDDATELRHHSWLEPGFIIIDDEAAQTLVDHVPDFHGAA